MQALVQGSVGHESCGSIQDDANDSALPCESKLDGIFGQDTGL
jgi:hypothetical protein